MAKVVSIINLKGGVGKTTTALELVAGLGKKGYKTLAIDLDGQCNLSFSFGIMQAGNTIYNMFEGTDVTEIIVNTSQGALIAGSEAMQLVEKELDGSPDRLRTLIDPLRADYDFIVIDTPPALNNLTINALMASDEVVIPTQADFYSLSGIGAIVETINSVKEAGNPTLNITGILFTRWSGTQTVSKNIFNAIADTAGDLHTRIFDTKIRECVAIKKAQGKQANIFDFDKRANASKDYLAFIDEFERSVAQ